MISIKIDQLIKRFESIKDELLKIENEKSVSIPVLADADGYLDKECPNPDCLFQFKVHSNDWKNIFRDEQVFCPMCRHEAKANSWWNSTQIQEARQQTLEFLRNRIRNAFSGSNLSVNQVFPIEAMKEMTLKIKCQVCNSRYSVIGSAFFCPCCGHNSVEKTFDESLNKVEIKLNNIQNIRKTIEIENKDEAEIICRSLVETSLNDCVVAFQRFCEATFVLENPTEKLSLNVFQRLEDGSKLWKGIFNQGYEDWLSETELVRMNIFFQRRHLLSHREGLVDEKYLQRANDSSYKLGQRIVVKENDVIELLKLIRKIVAKIREKKTK